MLLVSYERVFFSHFFHIVYNFQFLHMTMFIKLKTNI